jgi:hypothetical protein
MGAIPKVPNLPDGSSESDSSAVLRHDTRARFMLALAVIVQFVLLVGYIVFSGRELPDSQLILGAEISFVTTVISYFFGSSSGSTTKSASKTPESAPPAGS